MQDHINLAYDAVNKKTILFNGPTSGDNANAGTWAYDYITNNWSTLDTENSPTSDHSSFIYIRNMGKIMLFGNSDDGNAMETWIFDYALNDWTQMSSSQQPSSREEFGMAYNQDDDVFILIGGYPENDNWSLRVGP